MNIDKILEFEKYWNSEENSELRRSCSKGWAQCVWQASRESIEIELPEVKDLEIVGIGCTYEDSFVDYLAVVRAIEDAGLRVKP